MKLKTTVAEYELVGRDGYCFTVRAEFDPEHGWGATATMRSIGLRTMGDAVGFLEHPVSAFLRQLRDLDLPQDEENP